jgi:hypothetical protein
MSKGIHYRMTLRTVPSDRDVRTRLTGFRVDLGTRYVTVCMLQEGVGEAFSSIFTTDTKSWSIPD